MALMLYVLSYISLVVHVCFATVSFAAGLYYISELVEEYTETSKKIIKYLSLTTIGIYILLMISENFSWILIICGVFGQISHLFIVLYGFPSIKLFPFLTSLVLLLLNHYLAYKHFQEFYYSLSEILGYFTLCLWIVPFALFVSLSANDQTLPSYRQEEVPGNDVVTNYFSSSRKRMNLANFFKSAKDQLPTRGDKKSY